MGIIVQDDMTKIYDVSIGESVGGTILLHNPSDASITIRVTQADFLYNAQNEHFFLEPGKYMRSNADWIRVSGSFTVGARQSLHLPFTMSIPHTATLEGSYWSVLLLEQDTGYATQSEQDLIFSFRYNIQIISNIRNTGHVDLAFLDMFWIRDRVSINMRNTGTRWFDATIKIDIYDHEANFIASYVSGGNRIYPDLEKNISIPFTPLPLGEYYAIIVADCGANQIFGHQVSFRIVN
jgi:hypothetical protein